MEMLKDGCEHLPRTGDPADRFDGWADIRQRVACVTRMVEEMAEQAVDGTYTGTIGIEIPVRRGKLGEVRRCERRPAGPHAQ